MKMLTRSSGDLNSRFPLGTVVQNLLSAHEDQCEFKTLVMKMLSELRGRVGLSENFNKDRKHQREPVRHEDCNN